MINYDLFLEDGDLLDIVEIQKSLIIQDVVNEATIAGMKITKENLEDEKFVKELIKKIKSQKYDTRDKINMLMMVIGFISVISIVLLPVGLLLLAISSVIKTSSEVNEKDLKKLDECFEKTINKLEKQRSKAKNQDEYDSLIQKLKNNRKNIYNNEKKDESKQKFWSIVNKSKYVENGIKLGKTHLFCEVLDLEHIFSVEKDEYDDIVSDIEANLKVNKNDDFTQIEHLYANNVKSHSDLIKYLKNKQIYDQTNGKDDLAVNEYGPGVQKYLKNKKISIVIDLHDNFILYSHDDDCCYLWYAESNDDIEKISTQELLNASKIAYEDLYKVLKAYNKK